MFEKMKELIAEQLNCPAEEIKMESSFKEDLGADSLDLFELVMSLEDTYGVEIPSEELEQLTLGALRKAVVDGDVTNGSVMAGQCASMAHEIMTCKELITKLTCETDKLIGGSGFYE